jgi:hypothetical protein
VRHVDRAVAAPARRLDGVRLAKIAETEGVEGRPASFMPTPYSSFVLIESCCRISHHLMGIRSMIGDKHLNRTSATADPLSGLERRR